MAKKLYIYFPSSSTNFLCEKIFYKKMSLKNPKALRKCLKNLQTQMPELLF